MKVIISHDVDHLYNTDHFKDLYFLKLWVRSSIELLKYKLTVKEWMLRIAAPFKRKLHHLDDLMQFDAQQGIPSTFFFGMASGLYMSYIQKTVQPVIEYVQKQGFAVGVHGIAYNEIDAMKKEYDDFASLTKFESYGIRIHYVNYDDLTFGILSHIGYVYDTSEFDKENGYTLKVPYKIGDMWEFPLCIMDSYLPYNLKEAKKLTLDIISKVKEKNIPYFVLLFHDVYFCSAYKIYMEWYKWIIEYFIANSCSFVSYDEAIIELNNGKIEVI